LPLFHRDTIFPEDFDRLAAIGCDILVTHEAPSSHPHGFAAIDALAAACGARLIVHGHHHQSYAAELGNGIKVRGLGLAEPWLPAPADLECFGERPDAPERRGDDSIHQ
jgi:hypothetical protein